MAKASGVLITIVTTIIMTVLLVSTVNVGISLFIDRPDYDDYCDYYDMENRSDSYEECRQDYNEARDEYNQLRFYIFVALGIFFVLVGLFISLSYITWTALLTGLIFIGEALVFNLKNRIAVFITLIITTILIGYGAWRALKKFT